MAQLRQVFFAHSSDDLELVLESLLPDPLDPFPARGGQARPHGPAIGGVGHPLDQAVALQVIDKAGDVPGRRLEVFGEVPQWSVATPIRPSDRSWDSAHRSCSRWSVRDAIFIAASASTALMSTLRDSKRARMPTLYSRPDSSRASSWIGPSSVRSFAAVSGFKVSEFILKDFIIT